MSKHSKATADADTPKTKPGKAAARTGNVDVNLGESANRQVRQRQDIMMDIEQEVDRVFARMLKGSLFGASIFNLPNLFDQSGFSGPTSSSSAVGSRVPRVDVIDTGDKLAINAELPGVNKEDIEVSLEEDSVTVKVNSKTENDTEEDTYHQHEIHKQYSSRTVHLPSAVDSSKADAIFKDGVLTIKAPKAEAASRRTVPVS